MELWKQILIIVLAAILAGLLTPPVIKLLTRLGILKNKKSSNK
jgi:hypothetical protein